MDLFGKMDELRIEGTKPSDVLEYAYNWMAVSPDRWIKKAFFKTLAGQRADLEGAECACIWGSLRIATRDKGSLDQAAVEYCDRITVSKYGWCAVIANDAHIKSHDEVLEVLKLARELALSKGD